MPKEFVRALFSLSLALSLAACTASTPTALPVKQDEPTPTSQPEATATMSITATEALPLVTMDTPVPERMALHWYWSVDPDGHQVVVVNQSGERRVLGVLDQAVYPNIASLTLDHERALLLWGDYESLNLNLLTPDSLQTITLTADDYTYMDYEQSVGTFVTLYENYAVFAFATNLDAVTTAGPVFLIDLETLTASLIDLTGQRDHFRISQDGRFVRYLNGDETEIQIRELDLASGEVRTVQTTAGPASDLRGAPEGDLWYQHRSRIILDLNGNQTDFTADEAFTFRPLRDGQGVSFPRNCLDVCELKVFAPFASGFEPTYNFPWTIQSGATYSDVIQYLPDNSLLFVAGGYGYEDNKPEILETYPSLTEVDKPIFRLTPDGGARLIGIYLEAFVNSNASADGQYILVLSTDRTSIFMYDTLSDRPLFEVPLEPGLDNLLAFTEFFETGMLVNLNAAQPEIAPDAYWNYFYAYSQTAATMQGWEDADYEFSTCADMLADGSVVCWLYRTDTTVDLVRYDPASQTRTTLLENVWYIDLTP